MWVFKTGSFYVAQAGIRLVALLLLNAEITDRYPHHSRPRKGVLPADWIFQIYQHTPIPYNEATSPSESTLFKGTSLLGCQWYPNSHYCVVRAGPSNP